MNGVIITGTRQEPGATQFDGSSLFNQFVAYIDRGEKTTRNALNNLKQFAAWTKYAMIRQPGREDIINYRQWLLSEHEAISIAPGTAQGWTYRIDHSGQPIKIICKPATVKQYLQTVKQFFTWTAANGYYPNIAANVHAPKVTDEHKKDSLTAAEVLAIENSITARAEEKATAAAAAKKDAAGRTSRATEQGKRLYALYLLAVNAGLRTVELSRANVKDIQTRNGNSFIMVWGKGHSGADQRKPIAPEVKAAIDDYLQSRGDAPTGNSPLFVSTGNRSGGRRIAETTISTMLKKAMQAAGFDSDRLTAHSLRHTAGGEVMKLTGNNIYITQQYMRHSSPKTTEIYLNNDQTAQNEILARRLYDRYHGRSYERGRREELSAILAKLNAEQLANLTGVAAAMAM